MRHAVLVACVVISGACGLAFQVVWARLLAVFLGGSATAHALILASFLAGLAIGNAILGRWIDRRPQLAFVAYALLEALIGLYGFFSPTLFGAAGELYTTWTAGAPPDASLLGVKVAVSATFVILPTLAMGGTLPILIRGLATSGAAIGPAIARLYFVNTIGAAAGALLGGIWLLPLVGAAAAARWISLGNLAVAAVVGALAMAATGARAGIGPEPEGDAPERDALAEASPTPARRTLFAAAALTGFASLVLEVAWTRVFAMVFGSSAQAFALMLTAFLLGIAAGSALAERRLSRGSAPLALAALCLSVGVVVLAVQLPFYERLPYWQFRVAQALERRADVYPLYLACQCVLALLWMMPATLATGAALPLLARGVTRGVDDVGESVGTLFAVNTIGTVSGPVVATFVLMPALGLKATVTVSLVLFALAAAAIARAAAGAVPARVWGTALATALVALALPPWDASEMHAGGFRRWTLEPGSNYAEFVRTRHRSSVLYERDGPADSVVVLESRDGHRYIKVNGKTDASDDEDVPTQWLVAHLPLLLHAAWHDAPAERDVFVVGVGSGATVGAASLHEDVAVTAVDISRGVLEASRFFEHINFAYQERAEVHHGDAREWLRRDARRWDVIINQPSNPWIAGNAALFSREFFAMASDRLDAGGVFAQWMHVYAMDDASLELVMQTFSSVFPHVTVWWPQGVDLLLIGSMEPLTLTPASLERAMQAPGVSDPLASLDREGVRVTSAARLLSLQVLSEPAFRAAFDGAGPYTSDVVPRLEVRAPVAQFVGERTSRFVALDERLQPGARTPLLFDALRPLTDETLADLRTFFAARETPFSERIAGSLEHALVGASPRASEMAGFVERATGLPLILEAWSESILAQGPGSAATCRAHADALVATLPQRATAFYRPPLARHVAAMERCQALDSATSRYIEALRAELLVRTGYHAEGLAKLDILLTEAWPDTVRASLEDLAQHARARVDGAPAQR